MFRVSCKRNKHIQDVRYINDVSCLLFCQSFFQKQGLMKSHRASRMDDALSAGKEHDRVCVIRTGRSGVRRMADYR